MINYKQYLIEVNQSNKKGSNVSWLLGVHSFGELLVPR